MSALEFPPRPEDEEKVTPDHIKRWKRNIAKENHPDVVMQLPEKERERRETKFKEDMQTLSELKERLGLKEKPDAVSYSAEGEAVQHEEKSEDGVDASSTLPSRIRSGRKPKQLAGTKAITDQRAPIARRKGQAAGKAGEVLGTEVRETYVDFEEGDAAKASEPRTESSSQKMIADERKKASKKKGANEFTPHPDDISDSPRKSRGEHAKKKELPVIEHAPLSKEDEGMDDDELLLDQEAPHQIPATEEEKAEEAALASAIERSSGTDPEMIPAPEVRTQGHAYTDEDIAEARGHMEELRDGEQEDVRRFVAERKREHEQMWAERVGWELEALASQKPPQKETFTDEDAAIAESQAIEQNALETNEEHENDRAWATQAMEALEGLSHEPRSYPSAPPTPATSPAVHSHGGHAHGHGVGIKGVFKSVLGFGLVVTSLVFTGIWKMIEAPIKAIFENAKLGKGGGGGHKRGGGHDDHGGGHDDHH